MEKKKQSELFTDKALAASVFVDFEQGAIALRRFVR
jgi:hypothetical protein